MIYMIDMIYLSEVCSIQRVTKQPRTTVSAHNACYDRVLLNVPGLLA